MQSTGSLVELREHLVEARGHAVLNGRPYLDGAEVLCHPCRRNLTETDQVAWAVHREGRRWHVTVTHAACSPRPPA